MSCSPCACLLLSWKPSHTSPPKMYYRGDKSGARAGKSKGKQGGAEAAGVRWYDARARVALRRVALWLRVPATKLPIFECLLAQESQVGSSSPQFCSAVHFLQGKILLTIL